MRFNDAGQRKILIYHVSVYVKYMFPRSQYYVGQVQGLTRQENQSTKHYVFYVFYVFWQTMKKQKLHNRQLYMNNMFSRSR